MKRIIALMAVFAVGLGFYFFPQAHQWWLMREDIERNKTVDTVSQEQPPEVTNDLLTAAHAYNEALGHRPFSDFNAEDAAADNDYQRQLRTPVEDPETGELLPMTGYEVSPRDAIAKVSIPKINVSLPVYLGTTEEALTLGAGHIYGTSLPVGGPSTHTVITAHSRQGQAGRFAGLRDLEIGDEFFIIAAGQTMRYEVDQINVVEPDQVELLQIVPGEDYATLLTCTPLGINTHRLLVRGVRADLPLLNTGTAFTGHLPFPWFVVWFAVGVAASGLFGWAIQRKYRPRPAGAAARNNRGPVAHSSGRVKGRAQ